MNSAPGKNSARHSVFSLWLALMLAGVLGIALVRPHIEWDTRQIISSLPVLSRCLLDGNFARCQELSWYAPLQYLIGLPLYWLGLGPGATGRVFAVLNALLFAAIINTGYRALRRDYPRVARLFASALLLSPALCYGASSFSEMLLAASLVYLCSSIVAEKTPWHIFFSMFAVGLAKDSALLLAPLFAVGVVLLSAGQKPLRRRTGKVLTATCAGAAAALGVGVLFNQMRYGTNTNAFYLAPAMRVGDPVAVASHFAGAWLSPSGGLVFYWPLALPTLLACMYAARAKTLWRQPVLLAMLLLVAASLGNALWHSPFGWIAWGNRLGFPWTLAAVAYAVNAHALELEEQLLKWAQQLAHKGARSYRLGLAVMVATFGGAQVTALLIPDRAIWMPFQPSPACPETKLPQLDWPYYYTCLHDQMWGHGLIPLQLFSQTDTAVVSMLAASFFLVALGRWVTGR